jgi:RNA polymerase sigma factor (sigma-70 family)
MGVILAMVEDFALSEDLFQETVVEILKSAERTELQSEFLPWAKGVARNMVRRYYRSERSRRRSSYVADLEYMAELVISETDSRAWETEARALDTCVKRLSERHRKLLLARYGQGLKGRTLAERTGWKRASLLTTLARIRSFLRNCISAAASKSVVSEAG